MNDPCLTSPATPTTVHQRSLPLKRSRWPSASWPGQAVRANVALTTATGVRVRGVALLDVAALEDRDAHGAEVVRG